MIINLFVKNFGLIEKLNLDFSQGLNALTGETGAGKSIVIEALQVVLGGRANVDMIRTGEDKATVAAAFDLNDAPGSKEMLLERGIDQPDDGIITLGREITRTGKNICRVNGMVLSLQIYRQLGINLVDLHVQHEYHSLLDQRRQLGLLDQFGGKPISEALLAVKKAFNRWREARLRYHDLCGGQAGRVARLDSLLYECREIEKAGLSPGEDDKLANERELLINADKIQRLAGEAYISLYEGRQGQSGAVDLLGQAAACLKELAGVDPQARIFIDTLEGALYQVQELSRDLATHRERLENDPGRLEAVEERLELIRRLKKKYSGTIEKVLHYNDQARAEAEELENSGALAEKTAAELGEAENEYRRAAELLSQRRQEAAVELEKAITVELANLEMGRVEFQVAFSGGTEAVAEGVDQIDFLISPNAGEPLKPLAKIASGGELARVMLAIKTILAGIDEIPTLVFDEVDAGIGGRAIQSVAENLARISNYRQVLCVTHSAQVAAYASTHFLITKSETGGRTVTAVTPLGEGERLEELARMLGGREVSGVARLHASQLLKQASQKN
ncbi:MAG: DNA repair protein RecN [Eubacteriales bacterium]